MSICSISWSCKLTDFCDFVFFRDLIDSPVVVEREEEDMDTSPQPLQAR